VIANGLYYNPALTLAFLDSTKATEGIFKVWFKLLNDDAFELYDGIFLALLSILLFSRCSRLHEKKLTILGLSSMLHVPIQNWPRVAQNELPNITKAIMEVVKNYTELKQTIERALKEHEEAEEGDDDDDDEDQIGDDDDLADEECVSPLSASGGFVLTLPPYCSDDLLAIVNAAEAAEQAAFEDDADVGGDLFQAGTLGETVPLCP